MNKDFKINTNPNQTEIEIIKEWLIVEDKESDQGFFCNWNIIFDAFLEKKVISLRINENPIGFAVWRRNEIHIEIDILEIHPKHRKKGIGKFFFNEISNYFKGMGILILKLQCEPKESRFFWKKVDFIQFPSKCYSESDLTFYKPLINNQETSNGLNTGDKIELWDVEPYQAKDISPKWLWNIELDRGKLKLPIIHPCNSDWNLRWTRNGEIIKEDKVKYFETKDNRIEYSPFLYIKELIH